MASVESAPVLSTLNLSHLTTLTLCGLLLLPIFNALAEWSYFSWHPVLMSVAFILLMSEGIILTVFLRTKQRKLFLNIHLVLQLFSLLSAAIAFWVIYDNKPWRQRLRKVLAILGFISLWILLFRRPLIELSSANAREKPHFTSWHAWIGLLCCVSVALQNGLGAILYFYQFLSSGMESKRKGSLKKLLVSVHRYTAVTSFALGGNAIAFGLFTNYGMHIYGEDLLFCWAIALLIELHMCMVLCTIPAIRSIVENLLCTQEKALEMSGMRQIV